MADVFDEYQISQAWDEMFEAPGSPRRAYGPVFAALEHLDPTELRFRVDQVARAFTDQGVTFALGGEERPFPLDLVPRVPSGVSYVLENRRIMARTFPGLFAEHRVRPVDDYPVRLLSALRAAAPEGVRDPVVVVLTPGVANSAYFEHSLLARQMGVELVEGRDLICSGNRVRMRTTAGEQPVHVVYRRIDDEFLDPMHFLPESVIGCPGILNAARAGRVTIANAVGCGAVDDKLIYTYVPEVIRYYLGEEPVLENVETHRLDDPERLAWVLDSLADLVLKPVDGAGGKGIVIGPQADERTLAKLHAAVSADPRGWIAQRPLALSTSPTFVADRFAPRHIDLRPFAVNDGDNVLVLPGR